MVECRAKINTTLHLFQRQRINEVCVMVSGLAREVLRSQPKDIYAFGATYLDSLLNARDNGKYSVRQRCYLRVLETRVYAYQEKASCSCVLQEFWSKESLFIGNWNPQKFILRPSLFVFTVQSIRNGRKWHYCPRYMYSWSRLIRTRIFRNHTSAASTAGTSRFILKN